jgi:TRAP-type C4-dicarboxylate transport system permease small subunit
MTGLLGCVVLGVVSRGVGRPFAWTDEMAQHLLVWTGFVGWILAARRRSHIRIDVFIDRLPRPARLAAEIAIQAAVMVLASALFVYSFALIERNLDVEWVSLPLPGALLYLPIPFAALALIAQAGTEMAEAFRGRRRPESPSGTPP